MLPKVSIIIPVYNVKGEYLHTCISSVLDQTYENTDIVIVDDGSTRDIRNICDSYMDLDKRVRVIHQENRGASAARNRGVKDAVGDYIMFVDADDIVSKYMVESAVKSAINNRADFVIGMTENMWPNDLYRPEEQSAEEVVLNGKDSFKVLEKSFLFNSADEKLGIKKGKHFIGRGPVARIVKKEIAKKTDFPEDLACGEDFIWNMRVTKQCNIICIRNELWYGYLQHCSSIRAYRQDREEMSRRYLLTLRKENADIINEYPKAYWSCVATEFYILLRYNLLSQDCSLSSKQKKSLVKQLLLKDPWSCLDKKINRKDFSLSTKLFLISCDLGIWKPLLNAQIYKEKYIDKKYC